MPKIGEIREVTWENKPPTKYVGKYIEDIDAPAIITGKMQFVHDIQMPGMLYGKVKRSTVCHAIIRSVDTSAAKDLPGVVTVLEAKDIDNMKNLGARDLRRKIHMILSNEKDYQEATQEATQGHKWSETSQAHKAIVSYCKTASGANYSRCPILASREDIKRIGRVR